MLWTVQKAMLRAKQQLVKLVLKLITIPVPEVLSGAGSVKKLADVVKKDGLGNVLVVTDKVLMDLGLPNALLSALEEKGIRYTVFDDVQPNPTILNMNDGLRVYADHACEGIIAFGGGSPMDCGKIIGVLKSHPHLTVPELRGLGKIKKEIPPLYAVATTAGTGSEATVAAVVTDPENHEKFAVGHGKLVPKWAVLDPELTVSLPPHITAATGMDALTHAVEAYISLFATDYTDEYAEKAVEMIFANLEKAFQDGSDIKVRENMLMASYYAGIAFTRAMVGYVHAIAHNMGGLYGMPHGLANAIILPHVLAYSRKDAQKKLARLAVVANIGDKNDSEESLAEQFIESIREMNKNMGIPSGIKEIREEDLPLIVKRTMAEVSMADAPPTMMSPDECKKFVGKLKTA